MKKLTILGAIFLGFNASAQDVVVETIGENKILYRGFENKIVIHQINDSDETFEVEAVNCEVSKLNENKGKSTYLVRTKSSARTAQINLISEGRTVESTEFNVQNLPSPSLYWGKHKTGTKVSDSREIEIKYSAGVALKPSFEIVGWKCEQKGQEFKGKGNILSQALLDSTKSMESGEEISLVVKVKGADGIIRTVAGSWMKS
ncbi:MAG: hypothetical protein AB8B56_14420 [Crocinitomicaceae bacterium]